ncbi:MAG: polysaccharide biosynthesis tyrosine autokinase [Tannerellaceae bacterium]|jgi:capsular exopolysaccharide synthesis family protein|nr:polysaccharide biosynthesis tyrosine autokinase [Tannerellaceae bacterium]
MDDNRDLIAREAESEISLQDLFAVVKNNWMWFAISIIVCIIFAAVYLMWAPYVYSRTATVLIKDDGKGGAMSEAAAFGDIDMFNIKRSVDNEMLVFQSETLVKEVVKQLNLDVSYSMKEGLRTIELYTRSPVVFSFIDIDEAQSFTFTATPLPDKQVLLSHLPDHAENVTIAMNDTVDTPLGRVVATPTSYYDEDAYNLAIAVKKSKRISVVNGYKNKLKVALGSKTATIVNLSIDDVSIPRAEDFLNRLILVYNTSALNDKNQVLINTSNFIAERLRIIEEELGGVDSNIERYRRENQLTNLQSEVGMYLTESSRYSQEQLSLENQKELAVTIRNYLTDPARSAAMIPGNTMSDISIEGQITEYNTTVQRRDRLIQNSSARNPIVMDLNNSLDAMRRNIIQAIDNLIVGLDVKIRNVQASDRRNTSRIAAVPTQEKQLLSIERQQKIKEELYLYLLNKREENALSQSMAATSARIIDDATGTEVPVSPKSKIILAIAILLGAIIPAGIFWGMEMLNSTVRNRKDLEDAITVPYLGDVPLKVTKKGEKPNPVVVKEGGRDSISEAFRIIRTHMDFMNYKENERHQVIQLVSFQPGEGKTFVSINLAMSFALAQKRVLLVDLDIRRHTLSSTLQYEKGAIGVTNFLTGKVKDADMLISDKAASPHPNLDVISAGPIPPNPAELLLSDRLDAMIEALRKNYDYIFLDNVPAGMVADAKIVNRVADATIYVVRAGLMDRRMLPQLEQLYKTKEFKNMAVILNAVDYKHAGYSYSSYRYGYSYGYEYHKE